MLARRARRLGPGRGAGRVAVVALAADVDVAGREEGVGDERVRGVLDVRGVVVAGPDDSPAEGDLVVEGLVLWKLRGSTFES